MRLIDAEALMPNAEYKGKHDILTAYDIMAAPTVDAVLVVRCKDCIYYKDAKFNIVTAHDKVCGYTLNNHYYREPDDYCSKGK